MGLLPVRFVCAQIGGLENAINGEDAGTTAGDYSGRGLDATLGTGKSSSVGGCGGNPSTGSLAISCSGG